MRDGSEHGREAGRPLPDCLSTPTMVGVAAAPAGSTLGPRHPRGFELVWMIEGSADYEVGGTRIHAPEGSIVLCRSDVRDRFAWDARRGCRHGYVQFDLLSQPAELPRPDSWPVLTVPPPGDVARPLFRHVLTYRDDAPALRRLSLAALLACLVLGRTATHEPPRQLLPVPVQLAGRHIDRVLGEDPAARITLADIASAAHVTPEHLCRLFAASLGHSPMERVRYVRLDRATALLVRSNLSVAEIAARVGFADAFSFSKAYKRVVGVAPTEVRRRVHAGQTPPPRSVPSSMDMPAPPAAMDPGRAD